MSPTMHRILIRIAMIFIVTALPGSLWAQVTAPAGHGDLGTYAQGSLLALQAPLSVQKVEYLGETYQRGAQHPAYAFVLPVGLRQALGPARIQALRPDGETWTWKFKVGKPAYPEQSLTLKDTTRVDLSPENLKRVQSETARIVAAFQHRTAPKALPVFAEPLHNYVAGNRFGARRIINGQPRKRHTGADYGRPAGEPVFAVESGRVILAEEHFFAGNSIFIDHGDGWVSMYFHLNTMQVQSGDSVQRGQSIATVGSTGRATGPHLHFGFRYRNQIVDPDLVLQLFKKD